MQQIITEFFNAIYEAVKSDIPEFLDKAHQFEVAYALRNLDAPGSAEVLALNDAYGNRMKLLKSTYNQVIDTVGNMPEGLHAATLHVLSLQVGESVKAMGLNDTQIVAVNAELSQILEAYPATTEEIQQVVDMLQASNE